MNLFKHLQTSVLDIITALAADQGWPAERLPLSAIAVELPRNADHGDVAVNAAMVLAKPVQSNPRAIAELLKPKLEALPHCESVEIAGPGFMNLRFAPAFWQALLPEILQAELAYGDSDLGQYKRVNVEYVSANPTGPMHVGHARGAVVGDALASLMQKAGYRVTREYYVNDAGAQIDTLARSVYHRYAEALGHDLGEIPAGLYPGEYLVPVGKLAAEEFGDRYIGAEEAAWMVPFRQLATRQMMLLIRDDLALLNIHHDVFSSEWELSQTDAVEKTLQRLDEKGLIYTGVLEAPKGKAPPEDWEARPQTLFKSTEFGDDVDRALKKSDGSWTYFAPDIAYHDDKIQRGAELLIDILGADHGGYVKRITAAVKALSGGAVPLEVRLCQLVKFIKGGEPVKMSKRSGTFITVREVVEEVGSDALRFTMLTRKNDATLDFDMDKAVEQSRENPVFYVQYAHARCQSVLRMAAEEHQDLPMQGDVEALALLTHPAELALLKKLAYWPVVIEQAAIAAEPHRIAFYLQELAAEFHSLWNLGSGEAKLRFITDNPSQTSARLTLISAVALVLRGGLSILGVSSPQEMR